MGKGPPWLSPRIKSRKVSEGGRPEQPVLSWVQAAGPGGLIPWELQQGGGPELQLLWGESRPARGGRLVPVLRVAAVRRTGGGECTHGGEGASVAPAWVGCLCGTLCRQVTQGARGSVSPCTSEG